MKTYRCENVNNITDGTRNRNITKTAEIASKRLKTRVEGHTNPKAKKCGTTVTVTLRKARSYVKVCIWIALEGKKVL